MQDCFFNGLAFYGEDAGFRRRFEHWGFIIFYKGESGAIGDFETSVKIFMWWGCFSSIISEKLFLIQGKNCWAREVGYLV